MVEMVETATILNQATQRSLVILDEIGRGTSTYDGLSIAWAVVEHLHKKNRCRGLFASHYHELTKLATQLQSLVCYSMQVKEWQNKIVFLHKVKKGTAERSYGIHVAELAGLPQSVTGRAAEILRELEAEKNRSRVVRNESLPLFELAEAAARDEVLATEMEEEVTMSDVESLVAETDPDNMTPKQALELLYKLKLMSKRKL